ncbi:MAG: YncE family protein, partial [Opitutus sp.]
MGTQRLATIGRVAGVSILLAAASGNASSTLPGLQRDGSVLLPNQWSLQPVGRQIAVGNFPVNVALHPNTEIAAVLHSGYGQHEISLIDLSTARVLSTVNLEEAFYGLAWSPDGRRLYASGGGTEVIHAFDFKNGFLAKHRDFVLRPATEQGVPNGVSVSADGNALYVAESWGQRVEKISTKDGSRYWTHQLTPAASGTETMPEGERVKPSNHPESPWPYTCLPDEKHGRVFVTLWAKSAVLVLDSKTGAEVARWPVGSHPNEMLLARDGRLFVAEANLNTVSVVDSTTGHVTETLTASLFPHSPPGSMPNSLTLSTDGKQLFVANANNNNLAVFDVSTRGQAQSLGFIPVGWYPTSV